MNAYSRSVRRPYMLPPGTTMQYMMGLGQIDIDILLQNAITKIPGAKTKEELQKIDDEVWFGSGESAETLKESVYYNKYKELMNERYKQLAPDPAFDTEWLAKLNNKLNEWYPRIDAASEAKSYDQLMLIAREVERYMAKFPIMTTEQGKLESQSRFHAVFSKIQNLAGFEQYREQLKQALSGKESGFFQWLADTLGMNVDKLKNATLLVGGTLAGIAAIYAYKKR